jgi:hypothetical protein
MLTTALSLSDVHVSDHLSRESTAFTAQLQLNGRTIGTVTNDGTGGSHRIRIAADTDRAAFAELIAEWATAQHVAFEPADRLLNALLDLHEVTVAARLYSRRTGHPDVVCIRKGPFRLDSEPVAPPLGFEQTLLLPVADGDTAEAVAARERADDFVAFNFQWPTCFCSSPKRR